MSGIVTRRRGTEADYEAISHAVMETERGRWFLSEYARRNRQADTETLLAALARIERSVCAPRETPGLDKLRLDILEMSKAIARTHAEIASIRPDDASAGPIVEASGELDSIVSATESATSDILAAAESIQEAAWTLREANVEPAICDQLDSRATQIYTACSFQDLTAQRTRKVIEALEFLEQRVNAMVEIWQFAETPDAPAQAREARAPASPPGMSQADVDCVLVRPSEAAEGLDEMLFDPPAPAAPPPAAERLQLVHSRPEPAPESIPIAAPAAPPAPQATLPPVFAAPPVVEDTLRKVRAGAQLSADEATRALDALRDMSVEERTRLFS